MCAAMRVVVLLFLLSLWAGAGMGMTTNQLSTVVKYMTDGQKQVQYAMATGLPKTTCQDGKMTFIRPPALEKEQLFTSDELIAARPTGKQGKMTHSEYRLLVGGKNGLMKTLKNQECVVFYSYNSPCIEKCIIDQNCNIIQFLPEVFSGVDQNYKAFVFTKLYAPQCQTLPTRAEVYASFKTINAILPLYRCDQNVCFQCGHREMIPDDPCLRGYPQT